MTDAAALHAPWSLAKDYLNNLASIFGLPEDIANQGALNRYLRDTLRDWLCAAEALVRRLLLIEAAHCAVKAEASPKKPFRPKFKQERPPGAKRRASFRVFTDGPAIRLLSFKPRPERGPPPEHFSPAGFAARLEAVAAVVRNPARAILAVARRLRRDPLLAFGLVRHKPSAPRLVGVSDFRAATTKAMSALRAILGAEADLQPPE